jgi:hypothetical protein
MKKKRQRSVSREHLTFQPAGNGDNMSCALHRFRAATSDVRILKKETYNYRHNRFGIAEVTDQINKATTSCSPHSLLLRRFTYLPAGPTKNVVHDVDHV